MACSSLQSIKEKLKKEQKRAEALAKTWESVTYVVKQDGTPYKDIRRALSGASYRRIPYAPDSYHNEVYVHVWGPYGNEADSINAFSTNLKGCKKTENIHGDVYEFDLEDIKNVVKERARYWSDRAESFKKELEIADSAWEKYSPKLQNLLEEMEREVVIDGNRDLFQFIYDSLRIWIAQDETISP